MGRSKPGYATAEAGRIESWAFTGKLAVDVGHDQVSPEGNAQPYDPGENPATNGDQAQKQTDYKLSDSDQNAQNEHVEPGLQVAVDVVTDEVKYSAKLEGMNLTKMIKYAILMP